MGSTLQCVPWSPAAGILTSEHLYLVLDLAKGGELFDVIHKKGRFSERDAQVIFRQLCDAQAASPLPSKEVRFHPERVGWAGRARFGVMSQPLRTKWQFPTTLVINKKIRVPKILVYCPKGWILSNLAHQML